MALFKLVYLCTYYFFCPSDHMQGHTFYQWANLKLSRFSNRLKKRQKAEMHTSAFEITWIHKFTRCLFQEEQALIIFQTLLTSAGSEITFHNISVLLGSAGNRNYKVWKYDTSDCDRVAQWDSDCTVLALHTLCCPLPLQATFGKVSGAMDTGLLCWPSWCHWYHFTAVWLLFLHISWPLCGPDAAEPQKSWLCGPDTEVSWSPTKQASTELQYLISRMQLTTFSCQSESTFPVAF